MPKHDYHWTFGNGAHISFPNGGAPIATSPPHVFNSNEGCATWSDSSGNLVFYTDGSRLYDAANATINPPPAPPLGGTSSSAQAAIIVPPAGSGTLYHILTTGDWDVPGNHIGPVTHTAVAVAGGVAIASGPTPLTFGPMRAAEKLAATSHKDCNKYWVVSLNIAQSPTGSSTGPGTFYSMLIDSDAGPTPGKTYTSTFPYTATHGFCIKFSPDGTLLAVTSSPTSVDIFNFDRATGLLSVHSKIDSFPQSGGAYGVEFSPNGKYLYFTGYLTGYVNRHAIGPSGSPPTPFSATVQIGSWPTGGGPNNYKAGALQLGPNGKIYGAKVNQTSLFEIGLPDSATATGAGVAFNTVAQASGGPLTLNGTCLLGLPNFTRVATDCGDGCRELAAAVDEQLAGTPKLNPLRPCKQDQPVEQPRCLPVDLPHIAPWTSIRWGDSECDCIEGDDTEVLSLVVCNPYRNITLSNLVVNQLVVVQANGAPVPNLPDGSPSIELTPIGPYCFDDLAPCTCKTRQFVLRLRGAPGGPYRILVRGICFDVCFHGDQDACFVFNVCKD